MLILIGILNIFISMIIYHSWSFLVDFFSYETMILITTLYLLSGFLVLFFLEQYNQFITTIFYLLLLIVVIFLVGTDNIIDIIKSYINF